MPLFNKQELSEIWKGRSVKFSYKSSDVVLRELSNSFKETNTYDIFLSHSYKDKSIIIGLYEFIQDLGYSVYVDWIDDAQLDRVNVTKETANLLKTRMKRSRSLFFVTSINSPLSKWMPWELGYFDGFNSKAAILPILEEKSSIDDYKGQEYLGIYPYVTKGTDTNKKMRLWIRNSPTEYKDFDSWSKAVTPQKSIWG